MKVFRLAWRSDYQFLVPVSFDSGEQLAHLGTVGYQPGPPLQVRLVRENLDTLLAPTDFPWLTSNVPAFSERALSQLRPILEKHGSIIKLDSDQGNYFALSVNVWLDVVDMERSTVHRFRSGRVMEITDYVFRCGVIDGNEMFRSVHSDRAGDVFVVEQYVDRVQSTGLPGASFEYLADVDP